MKKLILPMICLLNACTTNDEQALLDGGPDAADSADVADLGAADAQRDAEPNPHDAGPLDAMPDAVIPPDSGCAAAEICNDLDDDCDGQVDEGHAVGRACTVGVGACQRAGERVCNADGIAVCSATPGDAAEEQCSGVDEDCDGQTDEGFALGERCDVGVGLCQRGGQTICTETGELGCSAVAGQAREETCDGIDEDCDGTIDEAVFGADCEAGQGVCRRGAVERCEAGQMVCPAMPIPPPGPEQCGNALDDDCDGQVDEPPPEPCEQMVGRCNQPAPPVCVDAQWACMPWEGPIPPECGPLDCADQPLTLVGQGATGAVQYLAPTAAAPVPALAWPTANGWTIQPIDAEARPVGDPISMAGNLNGLVRTGTGFASIEADDEGIRWLRADATGAIVQRAAYVYRFHGEPIPYHEFEGADLLAIDDGFLVTFSVWPADIDGMEMYGARLDAQGEPVGIHRAGFSATSGRLRQTPVGPVVLTTTYNAVDWNGPQNVRTPRAFAVVAMRLDGTLGGLGGRRVASAGDIMSNGESWLQYWQDSTGLRTWDGQIERVRATAGSATGIWRGDHGLLAWNATTEQGTSGLRAAQIDRTGRAVAPPFWLLAQRDGTARLFNMGAHPLLVLRTNAGAVSTRVGIDPVPCGDLQCEPGAWPIPPAGQCEGLAVCENPNACEPNGAICGCDGNDYPDRCAAMAQGVGVWRNAPCPDDIQNCDDGTWDRNADGRAVCRPCTAFEPVCAWPRGDNRETLGRVYRNLCAARVAVPNLEWTEGPCAIQWNCNPEVCDQICPVCGFDGMCYEQEDPAGNTCN